MIRRTILVMAATVVPLVAIPAAGAGAQSNTRPFVIGTGNPTCNNWSGEFKFVPPLTNGGVATSETVIFKAKAAGCSSGVPAPHRGVVSSTTVVSGPGANNCANFIPPLTSTINIPIAFTDNVVWHPTNLALANSTISFPGPLTVTSPTLGGSPITIGAVNGVVTGSFATPTASISVTTVPSWNTISSRCASALKTLNIGAGSTGTF